MICSWLEMESIANPANKSKFYIAITASTYLSHSNLITSTFFKMNLIEKGIVEYYSLKAFPVL